MGNLATTILIKNLTNFMELGPFLEVNLFTNSVNSQHFMEIKDSLLCSQQPTTGHILSRINLLHTVLNFLQEPF